MISPYPCFYLDYRIISISITKYSWTEGSDLMNCWSVSLISRLLKMISLFLKLGCMKKFTHNQCSAIRRTIDVISKLKVWKNGRFFMLFCISRNSIELQNTCTCWSVNAEDVSIEINKQRWLSSSLLPVEAL